MFRTDSSEFS